MQTGFTYNPIGVVRSPHTRSQATPIQPSFAGGVTGTVEMDPRLAPGLDGIEGFSHIQLVVALHAAEAMAPDDAAGLKVVPFLADEERGVFATRSPRRPNPIGLSTVRLVRREGNVLHVENLDLLDGTPVLDVKPYIPQFDIVPDAREGWVGAVTAAAARRGRRAYGAQTADATRRQATGEDDGDARSASTDSVSVTVLVDDSRGDVGLEAEHGLALWIETGSGAVLFDTGASALVVANAAHLDARLEEADAVVLSHGHYDHTGGLAAVLARARFARIVAHPAVSLPRWSRDPQGRAKDVGMPPQAFSALTACAARATLTTDHVEVVAGVHVTGAIPRRRDDERSAEPFFVDREMTLNDSLPDDQALWVETPSGPIVVVGCAHSGLLTTLDHIARLRGDDAVRAVVGGTHLLHADAARLERTTAELARHGVGFVAPGHCSGKAAVALLSERFAGRCQPFHVGRRLDFD